LFRFSDQLLTIPKAHLGASQALDGYELATYPDQGKYQKHHVNACVSISLEYHTRRTKGKTGGLLDVRPCTGIDFLGAWFNLLLFRMELPPGTEDITVFGENM
jgi:hypothetical protein